MDLTSEMVSYNQLNSTQPNTQTLIVVISLAKNGLLAESDRVNKKKYDEEVDQEIRLSPDSK